MGKKEQERAKGAGRGPSAGPTETKRGYRAPARSPWRILAPALLAAAVVALWMLKGGSGPDGEGGARGTGPARAAAPAPSESQLPPTAGAPPSESQSASARQSAQASPPTGPGAKGSAALGTVPSSSDPRRGAIYGSLEVPVGPESPGAVSVRLEPSRVLVAPGAAEAREVVLAPGEREFRFEGLPLGSYDLSAEAAGWFSARQPIALVPGSAEAVAVLALVRAGFVEGVVLDSSGAAVEGLELVLVPEPNGPRASARTRPDGAFRFRDVRDGEYTLHLGPTEHPLGAAQRISFRGPRMDLGVLRVEPVHPLLLRVVDQLGRPVPGARVRGLGSAGGVVDATTDSGGEVLAPLSRAGRYRLRAEHPDFGRGMAIEDLEFPSRDPLVVTIELKP